MTKIDNFTYLSQQHDDLDSALTAITTALPNCTLNCEEWTIASGAEQEIAAITLTALQNCIIEAHGYMCGWLHGLATLRLYIDGVLVAFLDTPAHAAFQIYSYEVRGYRAVASGNRVISLRVADRHAASNQIDVAASVFGACIKT